MEIKIERRDRPTPDVLQKMKEIKDIAQDILDEKLPILKGMDRILAISDGVSGTIHSQHQNEFRESVDFIGACHSSFDYLTKAEIEALDFSGFQFTSHKMSRNLPLEASAREWEITMGTEGKQGMNLKGDLMNLIAVMNKLIGSAD